MYCLMRLLHGCFCGTCMEKAISSLTNNNWLCIMLLYLVDVTTTFLMPQKTSSDCTFSKLMFFSSTRPV